VVTVDGQDISRISRDALRKRIMTLPQKSLFIHDSIRANMLMWDEATTASGTPEEIDAQIEGYLRKVGIWDALFTRKPSATSSSSTRGSSTSSITEVTDLTETTEAPADNEKEKKKKAKKSKKPKPTKAETAQDPENPKPKEEDEPITLDSPLNPESRLSIGQQQLFCLARALFQRGDSQIVLMDEFTSSMDHETEMLVREIVDRDLKGKTVIEVLHRLEHILDFDLVVVLEKGRVVEVGHPEELLQNEEGVLRDLYQSMRG
jgi:ABC-type multidrug transport system fused ATPase/permease subunit